MSNNSYIISHLNNIEINLKNLVIEYFYILTGKSINFKFSSGIFNLINIRKQRI
jgi:hypothetical protein